MVSFAPVLIADPRIQAEPWVGCFGFKCQSTGLSVHQSTWSRLQDYLWYIWNHRDTPSIILCCASLLQPKHKLECVSAPIFPALPSIVRDYGNLDEGVVDIQCINSVNTVWITLISPERTCLDEWKMTAKITNYDLACNKPLPKLGCIARCWMKGGEHSTEESALVTKEYVITVITCMPQPCTLLYKAECKFTSWQCT